jgi:GntR family colanic acid and biofilm gene transcriptional regulator
MSSALDMTMEEIDKASLSKQIYAAVREELSTGQFQPGERMSVRQLSEGLGTSQTPVREALLQLLAERVLITGEARSIQVPKLNKRSFMELREIRVALETLITRKATLCANEKTISKLQQLHAELIKAKANSDFKAAMRLNRFFHFELYRAADMPSLLAIIDNLWVQVGPLLNFLYPGPETSEKQHEHLVIIDAIKRRSPDEAANAVERDIVLGGRQILDYLDA